MIVSGRNGGLCLLVVAICNHVGNNETIAVIICSDDEMMVCLSESIPYFTLKDGNLQYSIMYVCICGQSQYTVQVGALSTLDRVVSAVKGSMFDGRVEYWHVLGGCHVL